MKKHTSVIVVLGLCLALLIPARPAAAQGVYRYFPETGKTVSGGFLEFFDYYGGLPVFGYPITDEVLEGGRTVQYFERLRLEWHPEVEGGQVQTGNLGFQVYGRVDPPVWDPLLPGVFYVEQTGHTVGGPFLAMWEQYGAGLFGNPISEPFQVGGTVYQYFERARMESDSGSNTVRLGSLGQEWLLMTPSVPNPPPAKPRQRFFAETGQFVNGDFLTYYETQSGVSTLGLPISSEFEEKSRTVQYFEKGRLELYPENDWPYRVQPGLVGLELYGKVDPPVANLAAPWSPNQRYFPETGHMVTNAFLSYLDANGGADALGYPISETMQEGDTIVQWFQRAKLEWHPENFINQQVTQTAIGYIAYEKTGRSRLPLWGKVGAVWHWNPPVQAGLGLAVADPYYRVSFVWQSFEGGEVFLRKDTNEIYALLKTGSWERFDNNWNTQEPTHIGYRSPEGKYEPVKEIGKVWRSLGGAGSQLGWAITEQRTFAGPLMEFERGIGVWDTEDWVYVLYNGNRWEKYQDMWGGGP
jgi:hypothetical protein